MPEYGRLLADKYRAAHGLLTSEEIRERRERMGLSQQNFADYLKRGVASVKRWEMGKIQDPANDVHIREMTEVGRMTTVAWLMGCEEGANVGATTTTTTIQGHLAGTTRTQGCIICNQAAEWRTTAAFDVRDISSDHSTSFKKVVRVKGLLNA